MREDSENQHKKKQRHLTSRFSSLEEWLANPSQHIPKAWLKDTQLTCPGIFKPK